MGILDEGKEIMDEYKNMPALDAGLLAAAQAVEHYEISRYGTLKCWASELGYNEAVKLLDTTLAEEKKTDAALPGSPKARSTCTHRRRKPRSQSTAGVIRHARMSERRGIISAMRRLHVAFKLIDALSESEDVVAPRVVDAFQRFGEPRNPGPKSL